MITKYEEFKEEVRTHEQRTRAVNAMLGSVALPKQKPAPADKPAPTIDATGRALGGAGRGRGRGRGDSIRQLGAGRGRGGGGAPPQDGYRTPGMGADGLPRHVKDVMPSALWKTPPHDACRMPPVCDNGKFPCVLQYYGMGCARCDMKPVATCVYRDKPRESNPAILQATRDKDPHYKEFEEASQNFGGNGGGQADTPPAR